MIELPELDVITDKVLAYRPPRGGAKMAEVREMEADGTTVKVIEIRFEIRREDWSEYAFADGGGLRFRPIIRRLWQVVDDDGTPVYLPDGDRYVIVEYKVDHVDITT
jgi:hypothetical protein